MQARKTYVNVSAPPTPDIKAHLIEVVGVTEYDKVVTLGQALCGITSVGSSQIFHFFYWKTAWKNGLALPTSSAADFTYFIEPSTWN